MNLIPGSKNITADSLVGSAVIPGANPKPVRVFCVTLVSSSTASTLVLRNGTSTSGTPYEQIDGVISQAVTKNYAGGMRFPNGCYADADANISYATIVFTEEF